MNTCPHHDRVIAYSFPWLGDVAQVHECNHCEDCGEWFSLGPANDGNARDLMDPIQVEIRLAKLLAEMMDQYEGQALEDAYETLPQVFAASGPDDCLDEEWCPCRTCDPPPTGRPLGRPLTPIEMMVYDACGFDRSAP